MRRINNNVCPDYTLNHEYVVELETYSPKIKYFHSIFSPYFGGRVANFKHDFPSHFLMES